MYEHASVGHNGSGYVDKSCNLMLKVTILLVTRLDNFPRVNAIDRVTIEISPLSWGGGGVSFYVPLINIIIRSYWVAYKLNPTF